MAHFAQLDANKVVTEVIVVSNAVIENLPFPESESLGVAFCQSLYGADTVWKQTSYNANFRGVYAGIGFVFDETNDVFVPPIVENGLITENNVVAPGIPAVISPEELP